MRKSPSDVDIAQEIEAAIIRLERMIEIQNRYLELYRQKLARRNFSREFPLDESEHLDKVA
jgi:HSP20 family molecular chaperone IbpA